MPFPSDARLREISWLWMFHSFHQGTNILTMSHITGLRSYNTCVLWKNSKLIVVEWYFGFFGIKFSTNLLQSAFCVTLWKEATSFSVQASCAYLIESVVSDI